MKFFTIRKLIIILLLIVAFIFGCNKSFDYNTTNYENLSDNKIDYNYYDVLNISPAKIIIPKNQTNSQSLSILVSNGQGNIIVFDGGRVEDADFLCEIIKDNGGKVDSWFISHIHDDHIGALYEILNKKRTDIEINEIVYNFPSFDWLYSKMGNDAGILYLFENAINEYNEYLESLNKRNICINDNKKKQYIYSYKSKTENVSTGILKTMQVEILNDVYLLDQDPINNTSIVYYVKIGDESSGLKNKGILVFGDLGYEGGNKLFRDKFSDYEYNNDLGNVDVLILSHHGQNGIDPQLYKKFNPSVVVWPTSQDIYENKNDRYYTSDTKNALKNIKSIKHQILSFKETAVIR